MYCYLSNVFLVEVSVALVVVASSKSDLLGDCCGQQTRGDQQQPRHRHVFIHST